MESSGNIYNIKHLTLEILQKWVLQIECSRRMVKKKCVRYHSVRHITINFMFKVNTTRVGFSDGLF